MEDKLGTLEEGKLADITVFDRDFLHADSANVKSAGVVMTIMDGKTVYKK